VRENRKLKRLLDILNGGRVGISHILLLADRLFRWLLGLLGRLGSLALGRKLSVQLGLGNLPLLLELVEVALGDWASEGADVVVLGDVDGLGGILTFIVEPVLE
jgi:hypothetical protein